MKPVPSKGPNSPYSPGTRTLLARTCAVCGALGDGDSLPLTGLKAYRRSECHACFNKRKKRDREERGIGLPPPRPPENLQVNRHIPWTQEDDNYLREHLGTDDVEDIAIALGRSINAIYVRRSILGLQSLRIRHRVAQPWRIG